MKGRIARVDSTDDRVEFIAQNIQKGRVSPIVHTYTSQALTDRCGDDWCVPEKNWQAEISQIAGHIRNTIRYTLDVYDLDTYRTPDRTIQLAMGDCDDMVALAGSVLQVAGCPIMIKVIRMEGQPDFHHIYLLAGTPPEDPQTWIPVDPTQPQAVGYEPPGIVDHRLYNVN